MIVFKESLSYKFLRLSIQKTITGRFFLAWVLRKTYTRIGFRWGCRIAGIPACDENGKLIDYYPQDDYPGKDRKRLNQYGAGFAPE
ncbi:MAG: hypothetical protein IJ899_16450 [Blautia sp.]|nr:hypothetical protein [Blautia sp.]